VPGSHRPFYRAWTPIGLVIGKGGSLVSTLKRAQGQTSPHAYNYLSLAYHQQQRYCKALTAYRQALQYDAKLQAVQAKIDA
jgi:hypothetical protein